MLEAKARVEASLSSAHHRASFLAASTQHSGDWLFALPIASCGLKLDDEAVRVAVGLRFGLDLCEPHQCHCVSESLPGDSTALFARELQAGQQDTMRCKTWLRVPLPQLGCPSQKSLPGCPGQTGSDLTASLLSLVA